MLMSLKPKSTELEASEEFVSIILEFRSIEGADNAFDHIAKAMTAGLLTISCGKPDCEPAVETRQ